jgi:hypothetical protein
MTESSLLAAQAAVDAAFESEQLASVDDLLATPEGEPSRASEMSGKDRHRLFVMYNNVLAHYGRNEVETVEPVLFIPQGWPYRLCCINHQARTIAKHFRSGLLSGAHTTYRCVAQPDDSPAKLRIRSELLRQYIAAIEEMEFFGRGIRCCEVLGVSSDKSSLSVTQRFFLNSTLYEVAANEGPGLRETLAKKCAQRITCEQCCVCEALLLFRRMHPEAITPSRFEPLRTEQWTHDASEVWPPLIQSGGYAGYSRLEKQNSLLWYFAGVEDSLRKFQCCIVELKSLLALRTYGEAIIFFHTSVMDLYLRRSGGEEYWDELQAKCIRPRLQANHVYLHARHCPTAPDKK